MSDIKESRRIKYHFVYVHLFLNYIVQTWFITGLYLFNRAWVEQLLKLG